MSPYFVTLANDAIELALWPDCGGRLISLRIGGAEMLWRNPEFFDPDGHLIRSKDSWPPLDGSMGSWANVGGSKTWPAPQGWSGPSQWPGPPDAVLDSGSWSISHHSGAASGEVTLTSPPDPRSGLQVVRSFRLPAHGAGFTQRNTFRNVSNRPVRWSIWEVCQVDTAGSRDGGELRVAVSDDTAPEVMIEASGAISTGSLLAGYRVVPVQSVVGKLGFPNASGSVELLRPDGASVRIEFVPEPDAEYPDEGNRVELWLQCPLDEPLAQFGGLHPRADLAELEVLGPLRTLAPGDEAVLELRWSGTPPRQDGSD